MSVLASTGWQAGFMALLPAVESHAQFRFRHLTPERREDLMGEVVASACVGFRRLAERGKTDVAHPASVADFAVRQARAGRRVGTKANSRDVMSRAAQRRHGFAVESLPTGYGESYTWRAVVLEDRRVHPADQAAFNLDFEVWFGLRSRRDRRIILSLVSGDRPGELAQRLGITAARISQLRRRYERQWQAFQHQAA